MTRPRTLITGASSGIGAAFAEQLAAKGYDLVVVARRENRLHDLADRLEREHGADVAVEVADLSSAADLDRLAAIVAGLELDLLVNNAGFGAYMPFLQLDPARAEELIRVQVLAPTLLARAVLPGMVERGRGAVVNVASALAFSGAIREAWLPPRATYAATKSYLVTLTQILSAELEGTGVTVQVLCPPTTATEFHDVQGIDTSHVERMSAAEVVRASLAALSSGEVICLPGLTDRQRISDWSAASTRLLRG
jgi:short-subunit dehydrogenase